MLKRVTAFLVLAFCVLMCSSSVAFAESEWTEADFAFYNSDMIVIKKPVAGKTMSYYINLKDGEAGQTYKGVHIGSYPEELLEKYDLSDAEWSIYDTSKDAAWGETDRSKALSEKWHSEGKTGADVIAMSDFLCAKGYYFYVKLDVYKQNGRFVTRSQIQLDNIIEEVREREISRLLQYTKATREELGEMFDQWYTEQGNDALASITQSYLDYHLRAHFQFCFENGVVTTIELSDYYYSNLDDVYNDDGTVNEAYAYVLDLK